MNSQTRAAAICGQTSKQSDMIPSMKEFPIPAQAETVLFLILTKNGVSVLVSAGLLKPADYQAPIGAMILALGVLIGEAPETWKAPGPSGGITAYKL